MTKKQHLRLAGISERTLTLYKKEVSLFLSHLEFNGKSLPRTYSRVDKYVAEYINHLYQEGEALTRAGWLLSGIKRLYPRMRKELAIAQQWYNNWCRQHTPHRAFPLTWKIVQSFAGLSLYQHWYGLTILYLVGFVFFLRTQELLELYPTDFKIDLSEGIILLRIGASKTSTTAQQSLAVRDKVLAGLLHFLLDKLKFDTKVWPYSLSHFRNTLRAFTAFFELTDLGFVPYSFRRGGATDLYVRTNSLDPVMIRGRWRDQTTARIYLDDARASLIQMRLSSTSQRLLRQFRVPFLQFSSRFAS